MCTPTWPKVEPFDICQEPPFLIRSTTLMTYNRKGHGRIDQESETTGKKILCRNSLNDGQATHITEGFSTNSRTYGIYTKNRKDETDRKTKIISEICKRNSIPKNSKFKGKAVFWANNEAAKQQLSPNVTRVFGRVFFPLLQEAGHREQAPASPKKGKTG